MIITRNRYNLWAVPALFVIALVGVLPALAQTGDLPDTIFERTEETAVDTSTRDTVRWGKPEKWGEYPFNPAEFSIRTVNGTRPAGSILLRAFDLRLEATDIDDTVTRTIALRIPVEVAPERLLRGFRTDLRGFLNKDADVKVEISLEAGGLHRVLEAPMGHEMRDFDINRSYMSRLNTIPKVNDFTLLRSETGYYEKQKAVKSYDLRIVLRITRPKGSSATAYAAIDSIDFAVLTR